MGKERGGQADRGRREPGRRIGERESQAGGSGKEREVDERAYRGRKELGGRIREGESQAGRSGKEKAGRRIRKERAGQVAQRWREPAGRSSGGDF